ncbi:hypothetical protein [Vibrio diabolicus]|uniref:hypothetical protein n=1 Tax=Vibrio diabolicus TaxID=50719 RepID=UPI00215EDE6B|nr:hypothetical protein [Vibrio diabolicus]
MTIKKYRMNTTPTIEFYYDYKKTRKDLSNVFRAMADYIEAYEVIEKAIVHNLEIGGYDGLKIQSLKEGSIKNVITSFCRMFLASSSTGLLEEFSGDSDGDSPTYYRNVEERQNDKFRSDWASDESFAEAIKANQIKQEIADDFFAGKIQAITDVDIAEAAKKVSLGNSRTKRGETFSVSAHNDDSYAPTSKVNLDMDFKVSKSVHAIFNSKLYEHNGEEIVRIIKPVQEGDDKWLVRNHQTALQYEAPILDKSFINEYQSKFQWLISMRVHSQYEVWRHGKETKVKNAKIHEVYKPYWATQHQNRLLDD